MPEPGTGATEIAMADLWKRANDLGDGTRQHMVYINAGAIGLTLSLATALYEGDQSVPFDWLESCVPAFAVGLFLTSIS